MILGHEVQWHPVVVEDDTEREVSLDDLRYEHLMATVDALRTALIEMPAPVVNVSEPDLSAVVNAVNGLRPGATAEEIGEAIVTRLGGVERPQVDETLAKLTEALERLDFRLKGIGSSSGGGGVSEIRNAPSTSLDTRDAQLEMQYEWTLSGSESVPLYIGSASPGTTTAQAAWRIEKYTYIAGPAGDAVPSLVQTATGAWADRASLF